MFKMALARDKISAGPLTGLLRTSLEEIAHTSGLDAADLSCEARSSDPSIQRRLREMMEVLDRVEAWHQSPLMAYAWYRDVSLPGFAGKTAEMLVREGQADAVMEYLDALSSGAYA